MAISNSSHLLKVGFALLAVLLALVPSGGTIGVCYGRDGNNLPSPAAVVNLYKSKNIGRMRLYYPSADVLRALRGSNIDLILDVSKNDIQGIATSTSTAAGWVQTNVRSYWPEVRFRYITVGNELIPRDGTSQYIHQAMQNIYNALSSAGLQNQIRVSTAVSTRVLGNSFPPSAGAFSGSARNYLSPIVQFLARTGAPLLVNVYPYFSYRDNPRDISLQYALFTSSGTVVQDGQFAYQNLFDAITDAVYAALEKVGGSNVAIVVSESGWPSAGGTAATVENARTYNSKLVAHVGKGTPRRAGKEIETYIFAMFNENQKQPAGVENHFGLFYPNQQPVYPINF